MRVGLLAVLLLAASLAGCAEGTDPAATMNEADTEDDTLGNATIEANNTAPVAQLTADVLNGTAPMLVNLTLDAFDADGDNLTWTLLFNDTVLADSTAPNATLPFVQNATLDAGNHTFFFTVSDGELNHTVNVTIEVLAGMVEDLGPCNGEAEPCIIATNTWVNFWSDGYCDMKSTYVYGQIVYVNDRYTIAPGTGLASGQGTWIYEESNGRSGMQVSADEGGEYAGCADGDILVF